MQVLYADAGSPTKYLTNQLNQQLGLDHGPALVWCNEPKVRWKNQPSATCQFGRGSAQAQMFLHVSSKHEMLILDDLVINRFACFLSLVCCVFLFILVCLQSAEALQVFGSS